jgi:bacteriorhodopsin
MSTKNTFYNTLIVSVVVQIITGIIEIVSLFVSGTIPLIRQLLVLEVIVQLIEGFFYIWLFFNFNQVTNVTPKRYIDWGITTPTMLIELILYLIYLKDKESGYDVTKLNFFSLLIENSSTISYVIFLNWLMFFIFWSLYGVVALLPYYIKNALYNILDLFAKNFFGLFLSYIILTGSY